MPCEDGGLALQGIIADVSGGQHLHETAKTLQRAARNLAAAMYDYPQWEVVRTALPPAARENIFDAATTDASFFSFVRDVFLSAAVVSRWPPPTGSEAVMGIQPTRPSTFEMRVAEAGLRSHLPYIAEHLADVGQAADEITADPGKRQAIERIAKIIGSTEASRLSPLALLVVTWWMFGVAYPDDAGTDASALALWYAVACELWKKDRPPR
jgi:hypothetical protein